MAYLEELLPKFRTGAKIRKNHWKKDRYLFLKDNNITNQVDFHVSFTGSDFEDDWELYQEYDWDYIIKKKCLCWFEDNNKDLKTLGILIGVRYENDYPFILAGDIRFAYKHCRPVRQDEVTFYEDREND